MNCQKNFYVYVIEFESDLSYFKLDNDECMVVESPLEATFYSTKKEAQSVLNDLKLNEDKYLQSGRIKRLYATVEKI